MRMPLPNAVMVAAVGVAICVQIALVLEFWGGFAGDNVLYRMVFQALGMAFALIELVALVVCANAAQDGAWARANVFRVVFIGLFAVNLVSDISAIYTFTTRDADVRAAAYQSSQTQLDITSDARARITALHETLAAQKLDEPAAALSIKRDAAIAARDEGGVGEVTQAWRDRRAAALDAALATAREIDRLETALETGRRALTDRPQSPQAPQTAALGTILSWVGVIVDDATIRTALALGMAVVLRGVIAFGFWAATPVGTTIAQGTSAAPPPKGRGQRDRRDSLMQSQAPNATAPPAQREPVLVSAEMPPDNVVPFAATPPVDLALNGRGKGSRQADLFDALDALEDEFRPKD